MKKLLLLLYALLIGVSGVWADVTAPTNYVSSVETGVNYFWCLDDGSHPRYIHADGTKTSGSAGLNNAGVFQFEDAGDGYYYIKEMTSGKYMYTDYAASVTLLSGTVGKPYAYYTNNVLSAGTKEDADNYKWKVEASSGTSVTNGFFVSSKANSNAVLAATGEKNTGVYFYQYTVTYNGNSKYPFANSRFLKIATSVSDLSNDWCYKILNCDFSNSRGFVCINSAATALTGSGSNSSDDDDKKNFVLYKSSDDYYLYSISEGKCVDNGGYVANLVSSPNHKLSISTESAGTWQLSLNGTANTDKINISGDLVKLNLSTVDAGTRFYVLPVRELTDVEKTAVAPMASLVSVNLKIVDTGNNVIKEYDNVTMRVGATYALPELYVRAYCSYAFYSDSSCETAHNTVLAGDDGQDIYVKCTFSGAPFEFATDVADANTNSKWEEFKLYDDAHYVYYNGSTLAYDATDLSTTDGYQWAFIGNPYAYKLYNKGAEGYLKASIPSSNTNTTNDFTFDETGVTFELFKYSGRNTDDHFVSVVQGTNNNYTTGTFLNYSNGWKIWCGLNNTAGLVCFNGLMTGLSQSFLLPIDVPTTKNVTFNVYVGEDIVATATGEVPVGEATADYIPSSLKLPYVTGFTCDPSVQGDSTTVSVTFTTALPFATDGTAYYMSVNNGKYVVYDDAHTPYQLSSSQIYGEKAQWTFTGNPYTGFRVANNAVDGKYLYYDSSKSGPVLAETATDWKIYYRTASTFALYTGTQMYINDNANNGILGYWNYATGYNSNGSTFVIEEVPADFATLVASNITPYYSKAGMYFGATNASKTALDNAGYAAATTSCDGDTYDALLARLSVNYPETGYYLIKNCNTNRYLAYGTPGQSGKANGLITLEGASSPANIIRLTKGEGNVYTISAQGLNVQAQTTANSTFTMTTSAGVDFTFTPQGSGFKIANSNSYVDANKPGTLFEASGWAAPYAVVNWEPSGAQGQWIVEDAPSTIPLSLNGPIDATYYATLCVPFDVTLPTGTSAYTLTLNDAETALTMSDALSEVPAGTPVLLKGSSASATATIGTGYAASPLTSTSLTGTYVSKAVTGSTDYFLGNYEGAVGFYHWAGSTLAANRAYFEASNLSGGSGVKGFGLEMDDTTVGLSSMPEPLQQENVSVYNFSGQRVAKPVRGLYIVNGKKVVVK